MSAPKPWSPQETELVLEPNPVVRMTRAAWRKTHKDYKGTVDGAKTVLWLVPGQGTCLVPVEIVD